jgi:hypothetical protein
LRSHAKVTDPVTDTGCNTANYEALGVLRTEETEAQVATLFQHKSEDEVLSISCILQFVAVTTLPQTFKQH